MSSQTNGHATAGRDASDGEVTKPVFILSESDSGPISAKGTNGEDVPVVSPMSKSDQGRPDAARTHNDDLKVEHDTRAWRA